MVSGEEEAEGADPKNVGTSERTDGASLAGAALARWDRIAFSSSCEIFCCMESRVAGSDMLDAHSPKQQQHCPSQTGS